MIDASVLASCSNVEAINCLCIQIELPAPLQISLCEKRLYHSPLVLLTSIVPQKSEWWAWHDRWVATDTTQSDRHSATAHSATACLRRNQCGCGKLAVTDPVCRSKELGDATSSFIDLHFTILRRGTAPNNARISMCGVLNWVVQSYSNH